ncbi:hypothetical protein EK21DRAFT_102134 [Setomelanomma holmii]|uniref:Heterokaryon incompatibility domain-containing protein n=1 Tax=Setomelanomma holmii TaxID=210430 RepID=A0A9P4H6E1_9PLEO|nr:hypothetical protein EK21DRAFT_102134 [Setomelanomma holmii]
MSSHWSYQYDTLPPGNYIRTLILKPGIDSETLQCDLQISPMNAVPFVAISYVWGQNMKNHEITCDGRTIAITTYLWILLRHIRSNVSRILWADSICINQENDEEKARQVAMMGQVFRAAEHVLIYIGADDLGHGRHVASLLSDMRIVIQEGLKQASSVQDAFPFPGDDTPILKDYRWKSYNHLLSQDWFTRGWAAVAQTARLIWGRYELSWEDLMRTDIWLMRRAPILRDVVRSRIEEDVKHSLLDVLGAAKDLNFYDKRDRIFAFAEVAQDYERHVPVHPDYKAHTLQVYHRFSIDFIRSTRDTEILDGVYHTERSLSHNCPSWVPRWDNEGTTLAPSRSSDWMPLKPLKLDVQPTLVSDNILRVPGVFTDTIVYISEIFDDSATSLETIRGLWNSVNFLTVEWAYPTAHRIDAFLDKLVRGMFDGKWETWKESRANLAHDLQDNGLIPAETARIRVDVNEMATSQYVTFAKLMTQSTRFVVTKRGYMGLAPQLTRIGDATAIIFSCVTSCVLREAVDVQQYQCIGPAWIAGAQPRNSDGGGVHFRQLGDERSRDWIYWDVKEQDIDLC